MSLISSCLEVSGESVFWSSWQGYGCMLRLLLLFLLPPLLLFLLLSSWVCADYVHSCHLLIFLLTAIDHQPATQHTELTYRLMRLPVNATTKQSTYTSSTLPLLICSHDKLIILIQREEKSSYVVDFTILPTFRVHDTSRSLYGATHGRQ